jgi:hypothetical protein
MTRPRHVVIYPAVPVWQVVVMGLVAAFIGVCVAGAL